MNCGAGNGAMFIKIQQTMNSLKNRDIEKGIHCSQRQSPEPDLYPFELLLWEFLFPL